MTLRAWFGHKLFGAGFSPTTWQGWLSTLAFVVIVAGGMKLILDRGAAHPFVGLICAAWAILTTVGFLAFVWIKRDRSRPVKFRWGSKN